MALDAGDDAGVAGHFGVPAAGCDVVVEGADVVELLLERGCELGAGPSSSQHYGKSPARML